MKASAFIDKYQWQARVVPALLVLLPLLVPIVFAFGPKDPVLTGLVGLLASCGAFYVLANIARGRGKVLEEHLAFRWGGMPTTILLRHRDRTLDQVSKAHYHHLIEMKLGVAMPSVEEERIDPDRCDGIYIGATRRLRERTRSMQGLLLKENIAYGFHRNARALKPLGIASCMIAILYALVASGILVSTIPYVLWANILRPGLPGGLTLAVSLCTLFAWIFYFNDDAVKRVGFVYAERLFECLEALPDSR